jgi:hypothetical protein
MRSAGAEGRPAAAHFERRPKRSTNLRERWPSNEIRGSAVDLLTAARATIRKQRKTPMAKATGDIIETPTQQLPFKAVIKLDGKIINEEFFRTRDAAEEYILEAVQWPEDLPQKGGTLR